MNKNFFFTFGQQHRNNNGQRMKDFYVKVTASSWDKAREIFITFAKKNMKDGKWGEQYEEDKFKSYLYPDGEYEHLTEG
jgi:hypothetical protein